MKIELEPTDVFENVDQGKGLVSCRVWRGTFNGFPIIAHIACVGLHNDAPKEAHELFARELREVKASRNLVSFDMRMVLD